MVLEEIKPESLNGSNPFLKFVKDQHIVEIPVLRLESGIEVRNVAVAYKSWGSLNETKDNVVVVCHGLTGACDITSWWAPLFGNGRVLDPSRSFIICLNSLGSPYGSFSPLSIDAVTGLPYGPEFPLCTVRDDVAAHKLVLDSLGVNSIAFVIGGSMGGMLALEWAATYGSEYVQHVIALATTAQSSAWCMAWSELQRQSIYSDQKYRGGYYSQDDPPVSGLASARISGLMTYRTRDSFESRFSRSTPSTVEGRPPPLCEKDGRTSLRGHSYAIHNDGLTSSSRPEAENEISPQSSDDSLKLKYSTSSATLVSSQNSLKEQISCNDIQTYFSVQSYLRYQGSKFVKRFDANCYIALTRKMDTHDLARDRPEYNGDISKALRSLSQPVLVIGIHSDCLFPYQEQELLAKNILKCRLEKIVSSDGHDAYLLESPLINSIVLDFLQKHLKDKSTVVAQPWEQSTESIGNSEFVFGVDED
ncbi:HCL620Wp [Eremothecium sinecaudum]|uniref:HCL620Wp n=1 Tax=Eremothecium sinecaudum TaxID=45286 RepID=A0A120K1N4_9SACH|nr:HCL620Wp [Eremothecium sinecaudum]AMD19531.1 HCL620Wp [Eremothecium sinecaudum]